MNFLGIYREPEYSPGRHLSNDAKILRLVPLPSKKVTATKSRSPHLGGVAIPRSPRASSIS